MTTKKQEVAVPAAVQEAKKSVDALIFKADMAAQVTDVASEEAAIAFLGEIKKQFNSVEEKRKFLVKPLQDHVKRINEEFKRLTDPLQEAERTIKKGVSDWRMSEDFREREAQRLAIASEARSAAKQGDVEKLEELAPQYEAAAAEAPRSVAAGSTKASFRTIYKYEIIEPKDVPPEFCSPDAKKINAAVQAGQGIIPGVRIWSEKSVAVSV